MKFEESFKQGAAEQRALDDRVMGHVMRFNARGDKFKVALLNGDPISKEDYRAIFSKYINKGDSILVVGSGAVDVLRQENHQTHELVAVAKEKEAHVLVSDLYDTNAIIQKEYKEMKGNSHAHVLVADAMQLPLADSSINGIVSSNLINCPPEEFSQKSITIKEQAGLLLREAFRVLKPGGFIVITSFGYSEEGKDASGNSIYNNNIREDDMLRLTELEVFLDKAGFSNIRELLPKESWGRVRNSLGSAYVESGGYIARKPKDFNVA